MKSVFKPLNLFVLDTTTFKGILILFDIEYFLNPCLKKDLCWFSFDQMDVLNPSDKGEIAI